MVLRLQPLFPFGRKDSLSQETVVRGARHIINFVGPCSLTALLLQLHHRLEEAHVTHDQGIEAVQLVQGLGRMVAVIADEAA